MDFGSIWLLEFLSYSDSGFSIRKKHMDRALDIVIIAAIFSLSFHHSLFSLPFSCLLCLLLVYSIFLSFFVAIFLFCIYSLILSFFFLSFFLFLSNDLTRYEICCLLCVQEVVTNLYGNLHYKMSHYFLDI